MGGAWFFGLGRKETGEWPRLFRLGYLLVIGGLILGLPVVALKLGTPATMGIGLAVAAIGLVLMVIAVFRKYRGKNG